MRTDRWLPLVLGLGWMGGYRAVTGGWPPLPPLDASGWLFWLAGVLGVGGALLPSVRPALRLGLAIGLSAPVLYGILAARVHYAWTPVVAGLWIGGLALAFGACTAVNAAVALKLPPRPALASLLVTTGGAAVALGTTGSLLLGGLGAVLAAEMAVLLVRPSEAGVRAARIVAMPVLFGAVVIGGFYSALPVGSAALLLLAPMGALVVGRARPWLGVLACALLALAAIGVGLAQAGLMDAAAKLVSELHH